MHTRRRTMRHTLRPRASQLTGFLALLAAALFAPTAEAQTDFYNTSRGRPLRIQDAAPVEYRAIEIDVAPLALELGQNSSRRWSLHPEVSLGILPRTQVQVALPLAYVDANRTSHRGLGGVELSVLHALNAETRIPALALAADLFLPAGPLAGEDTYGSLEAIVTRTTPWARLHFNAQLTAGPARRSAVDLPTDDAAPPSGPDASRWMAGIALDRTFPLHSVLVAVETFAERPLAGDPAVAWHAATGTRVQLTPRWALDAGVGRRFTGADRTWNFTLGSALALGFP